MKTELRANLRNALMITRPDIGKDYLYDRCVNKYVDAMLLAISSALSLNYKSSTVQSNCFMFSQTEIREAIGTTGKKQEYIYQIMKNDVTTSLLVVVSKGFSKNGISKLSTVKLNDTYKDLVMEELLNLRVETNQKLLDEIEQDANYTVNVDPASLASFITKTTETIRTTRNGYAYKEKLLRNLTAARQLQAMINPADDTNTLPYIKERWEIADCGRIYGQGYSLQRMPKEVRHAALGVCHKYDFKASAFALMAGLASAINPAIGLGAVLDYVKNRQVIRKRIAAQLGISENIVKTIFTALGFGAELKNNQHSAIRGALGAAARMQHDTSVREDSRVYNNLGEEEFKQLVNNDTFGYIYEELQAINATIIEYFKTNELVIGDLTYNEINPKTGRKRNNRQKLAWIYQALESMAMKQFAELAEQEALLTTHDCIYFKNKLPASVVVDATAQLQQRFQYLRFEHEKIYPIADDEQFDARFSEADCFEQQHKQLIAEQTELARHYCTAKSQWLSVDTTAHNALRESFAYA
jgi:hypothetical protein